MITGPINFFAARNEQPLKGRVATRQAFFWRLRPIGEMTSANARRDLQRYWCRSYGYHSLRRSSCVAAMFQCHEPRRLAR